MQKSNDEYLIFKIQLQCLQFLKGGLNSYKHKEVVYDALVEENNVNSV